MKYGECRIFNDQVWEAQEAREPSVVSENTEQMVINEDEKNLLRLGPKFCVMGKLSEEAFRVELEQTIMKVKWEIMGEEEKVKKRKIEDVAINCVIDEEQKDECAEYEEMLDARTRMIYDQDKHSIDFGRRRTTDLKNNARVIFPKTLDFQTEAKLR